jgi:hypothetical protein
MMVRIFERLLTGVVDACYGVSGRLGFARKLGRFALMASILAALILLPWRPSPQTATWVSVVLIGLGLAIAIGALTALRRVLARLVALDGDTISLLGGRIELAVPIVGTNVRAVEGSLQLVRRAGVALPALVFFIFWALVYMLIWSRSPAACAADPAVACGGAFWGAGADPSFGDFVYLSVNMAFANPVPDLMARSQVAKAAATLEVLTGIGLATLYASSFFGLRGEAPDPAAAANAPLES